MQLQNFVAFSHVLTAALQAVQHWWEEVQAKKISIEEARRKILELESEEVDT
jgi:hypothetical protein